jgi:hypothetical protein
MRKIEERIIKAINYRDSAHRLSVRDVVYSGALEGDDCVLVYLWDTCIARIYPKAVEIDTGGWRTNTTKSRLNAILWEYCRAKIYSVDCTWMIDTMGKGYDHPVFTYATGRQTTVTQEYKDGMSIPRDF